MSQAPAMPVFTDALIGDTTHLSAEEFGAYCLILFATWRNSGVPIADDDRRMARICRVSESRWKGKLRSAMVGFFDLSADTWRQKRLEKEWNFCAELRAKNSEAGKASARARALKTNNTYSTSVASTLQPNGQRNVNPQSHTLKEEEKDSLSGVQKERAKRRQQVPEDWEPSETGRAFAAKHAGWLGQRLDNEVGHFRDHHRRNGTVFADIEAAWRTWVRNGTKFEKARSANGRSRASATDNLIEGFGRAAGLGRPADSEPDWEAAGPLLDGEYARLRA